MRKLREVAAELVAVGGLNPRPQKADESRLLFGRNRVCRDSPKQGVRGIVFRVMISCDDYSEGLSGFIRA